MVGSTHPLSPPEIVVHAMPDDERVWVPQADVGLVPAADAQHADRASGATCCGCAGPASSRATATRTRCTASCSRAAGATSSTTGSPTTGDYVFEPPGETHTLTVPEDVPEMVTFFNISGCMYYVDEARAGTPASRTSSPRSTCAAPTTTRVGLGADYVDQFIR